MRNLGLITVSIAILCINHSVRGDETPPNIILVMADDLGYGDVAYNGNPRVRTPNLDVMAKEGIRLDRFYAAAPVCTPTRASCLTGRHPYRMNMRWAGSGSLPEQETTIAEALKERGYATGHFGKWHVGGLSKTIKQTYAPGPVDPDKYSPPWKNGFDECFSVANSVPLFNPYYLTCGELGTEGYRMVMDRPVSLGQRTGGFRWRDIFWVGPGQIVDEWLEGDTPKIIMDRAIDFIERSRRDDRPFLALVWFSTPHTPVVASDENRKLYPDCTIEAQHWYGCITAMDKQVGRLRAKLREMGISDNTIVWFCSDNGPTWVHDHGSAGPLRGRKASIWEGGVRVPGIVEWPARFKEPGVIGAPICTSDFLPTLVTTAGADVQRKLPLDGIDVMPLLEGKQKKRSHPIGFQSPILQDNSQSATAWTDIGGQQLAWVDDRYKIISLDDGKSWQLYDLIEDIGETRDIAAAHPDIVERMEKELRDWTESCRRSAQGEDYIAGKAPAAGQQSGSE